MDSRVAALDRARATSGRVRRVVASGNDGRVSRRGGGEDEYSGKTSDHVGEV